MKPPTIDLDLTSVLESENPFERYCKILSDSFEFFEHTKLVDSGAVSSATHNDDKRNWNRERKSLYIIAKNGDYIGTDGMMVPPSTTVSSISKSAV